MYLDLYSPTLSITSKAYGAANFTITVEWTGLVGTVYNVEIFPSVPITKSINNSYQLTISYNTEYNLTVEASAPCKPNSTAFINLHYGEVELSITIIARNKLLLYYKLYIIANCGHPELLSIGEANDSVPSIEGYNGIPIEDSTITFSCPPGLSLIGPNVATCTETGQWDPDISGLLCNDTKGW